MMAKNKYMMKVSLSVNGVNKLLKFSKVLQKDMPTLEKRFVEKSLAFIQERANEYIKATTGNSDWYVLTHQLENSWVFCVCRIWNRCCRGWNTPGEWRLPV